MNFSTMSLVVGSLERELDGDLEHVLAVERHPGRAVGLLEVATGRQRRAAVEDADVVEAEESALENVAAGAVLAVHPPVKFSSSFWKTRSSQSTIALAALRPVEAVGEDRRPRMHRRVHVAEVPFVRRASARWDAGTARGSSSSSCSLPKSWSTSVSAITWNARSHAAYQGYSHLSGIEMTSALTM